MDLVAGELGQHPRHRADHAVAGIVAEGVVDPLEIVDVANRHAERFDVLVGLADFLFQQGLETAPVGQAGQVIDVGQPPHLLEFAAKLLRFALAAPQPFLEMERIGDHPLRGFQPARKGLCRHVLHVADLADALLDGAAIVRHGRARRRRRALKVGDGGIELLGHLIELAGQVAVLPVVLRLSGEPFLRDRQSGLDLQGNLAAQAQVAARAYRVGGKHIACRQWQIVFDHKGLHRFEHLRASVPHAIGELQARRQTPVALGRGLVARNPEQVAHELPGTLSESCIMFHVVSP